MLHCVFRASAPLPPLPWSGWLSLAERARLEGLRCEKRRLDWLRGRHAAKQAAARALRVGWGGAPGLASLQLDAAESGAPFLRLAPEAPAFLGFAPGGRLPLLVSVSHSDGGVFCAASCRPAGLGVDLERIEPRAESFVADFFAAEEAASCARGPVSRDQAVTTLWCAKEAVLKALQLGLGVDTRDVVCRLHDGEAPGPLGPGWRPFQVLKAPRAACPAFAGWWRERDGFALAVALLPAAPRCPA